MGDEKGDVHGARLAVPTRELGRTGLVVSRLGLGLAAVARPAYITLGREGDLPTERTVDALAGRCNDLLDAATERGVRYLDVARSYGLAEEFLRRWLDRRVGSSRPAHAVAVGSKWGYRYTADWRSDAAVHEQKELSLDRFRSQLAESKRILAHRLDLYQIHSATVESGCLDDSALLAALVEARRTGVVRALGLTLSGASSLRALEMALEARVDGERVFDTVQATFNVLEPSLRDGLAAAHRAGLGVIAKEVHANGRLADGNSRPTDTRLMTELRAMSERVGASADRLALAFALAHPFVDVALSGAATIAQLESHVAALAVTLSGDDLTALASLAEAPAAYWRTRATLPWT